jgi:ATP adenylyltransferase
MRSRLCVQEAEMCPIWSFPAFDFARRSSYCSAMDSLQAPWRIEYILAPKPVMDGSLFTRIAQSGDDVANLVIARDKTCYALLNRYPYNGGHLMIVPYKETPSLDGLTEQELADLMLLTRRCQAALTKVMKPDGFNIGINQGKCAGRRGCADVRRCPRPRTCPD